jgi:putative heme-binding domain-containing protein
MIASGPNSESIHDLIKKCVAPAAESQAAWQGPLLQGISEGLKTQKSLSQYQRLQNLLIKTLLAHPSGQVRNASLSMLKVIGLQNDGLLEKARKKAAAIAGNQKEPEDRRVEAIQFIALGNPAPYADLLKELISATEQSSIQVAALKTLSAIPGNTGSKYILTKWGDLTPEIRNEAINTFFVDSPRIAMLLDAIESGRIHTSAIGWPRSVRLMAQKDLKLRDRARKLLTKDESERQRVNKAYQGALSLNGDPENGRQIFLKNCASCHQIRGDMGADFGPDLGTVHNWSPDAILANILAPDLSISSGYDLWVVELKNGESFQGLIASETTTAITLKNAEREARTINRTDIKSLKALNMSSMPAGFEKQINQQQMADLLAFLKQNK